MRVTCCGASTACCAQAERVFSGRLGTLYFMEGLLEPGSLQQIHQCGPDWHMARTPNIPIKAEKIVGIVTPAANRTVTCTALPHRLAVGRR